MLGRVGRLVVALIALASASIGVAMIAPQVVGATSSPSAHAGYWLVASDGGVFSFAQPGTTPIFYGSTGSLTLNKPIVGMAPYPTGKGYWLVASDGGVFSFAQPGTTPIFYGSTGSLTLNKPIVGMAPYPTGKGYWLVASDGGVFSFAQPGTTPIFYGSTGSLTLNKPIVGMAPYPTGKGYWLVASDGGVFSFAQPGTTPIFYGSTGSLTLNKPIVGMAPYPTGKGYWLVASDGGVFSFAQPGTTPIFYGSTGSLTLNKPIVGMAPYPTGKGYWLVASDGGVFSFAQPGTTPIFYGSTGSLTLNKPIVGMAPYPPSVTLTSPTSTTPRTTSKPIVTSLSPTTGSVAGGTAVTIDGTNLGAATVVRFATAGATITSDTATRIVAVAPLHTAGTVNITVTTPSGTSAVGSADHFNYVKPPTTPTSPYTLRPTFPTINTADSTQAITTRDVGDLVAVIVHTEPSGGTSHVSSITDTTDRVAWQSSAAAVLTQLTGSANRIELWYGTVTETGPTTIETHWSGTTFDEFIYTWEIGSSHGSSSVWSVTDAEPKVSTIAVGTTITWPTLESGPTGGLYLGWIYPAPGALGVVGSTPGFSYELDNHANVLCWDLGLAPSTHYAPTASQTVPTVFDVGIAGIFAAT